MAWKIIDRLLLPAVFALIAFIVTVTLWDLVISNRRFEIQQATRGQAAFVKIKTESELEARVESLERLAARWHTAVKPSNAMMQSDVSLVMAGYPNYSSIVFVDPTFRALWTIPQSPSGSSVVSGQPISAAEKSLLVSASHSQTAFVSHPQELASGQDEVLVCVPVFNSANRLFGYLTGTLRYESVLSSILQGVIQDYRVNLYDGTQKIYGQGVTLAPQDASWTQSADIHFHQLTWRVQVWPNPEALSYVRSTVPTVVLIAGIFMGALLAFTVYLAETARLRAKKLAASNEQLKQEIEGRAQVEQALRDAQKMEAVGRLAGGVAHDFNNLLMVIRGHAALSLNRVPAQNTLHRELSEILKTTDRASALTRKLLAFSRKQVLQLRVLDVNALVQQAKDLLPPVLGEDIKLTLKLDPDLGRVKADAAQMEQVIMNLVFNARDAMANGGKLTIETANVNLDDSWSGRHAGMRAGPHVMLSVTDTGHGMTEEIQSHIFEPFFTTKDRTKGTGLGLASVYGTVRQIGGCVTVSSTAGEGTTFRIYMPIVEEALQETEAPVAIAPEPEKGAETILVVEDDDAVRRMTREFLKIKGYTVIEANNANGAIQLMQNHKDGIDLVLTDVLMPGMKGRELVERLQEIRPDLKVLYMSAYTEDAAINIGVLSSGTEFIEKPFSPDDLAGKVRDVLKRTAPDRIKTNR